MLQLPDLHCTMRGHSGYPNEYAQRAIKVKVETVPFATTMMMAWLTAAANT